MIGDLFTFFAFFLFPFSSASIVVARRLLPTACSIFQPIPKTYPMEKAISMEDEIKKTNINSEK